MNCAIRILLFAALAHMGVVQAADLRLNPYGIDLERGDLSMAGAVMGTTSTHSTTGSHPLEAACTGPDCSDRRVCVGEQTFNEEGTCVCPTGLVANGEGVCAIPATEGYGGIPVMNLETGIILLVDFEELEVGDDGRVTNYEHGNGDVYWPHVSVSTTSPIRGTME